MTKILLFDVDGTIAESGKKISPEMKELLSSLKQENGFELGIVGGGTFEKISYQLDGLDVKYIFSECGCCYHKLDDNGDMKCIYEKKIHNHEIFEWVEQIIRMALHFIIHKVSTPISGHFVDIRKGLVYISLIGMQADDEQRKAFKNIDEIKNLRQELIQEIQNSLPQSFRQKIDVKIGGSTGITIIPVEWNKEQVMHVREISEYNEIYYFGDKYEKDGNDYELLFHRDVIGVPVQTIENTIAFLKKLKK